MAGSRPGGHERAVGTSERAYRSFLRAYPRDLRDEYGDEMARCFRELCREALEGRGGLGLAALWVRTLPELIYTALKERSSMLTRNTYRATVGVALAAAFLLAWMDLAVSAVEEPDGLAMLAPIGFFAVPVVGAVIAYRETKRRGTAYRAAVGVALAVAFLLAWVNLAVGIIGSEDNPANLMYIGVLAVGITGATIARFRPRGMARALFATALAQALAAVVALIFGLGLPWSPPVEILAVNGFFVVLFVGSALLFRYAGRGQQTPAGAGQEG
jgi:hypothetical protein